MPLDSLVLVAALGIASSLPLPMRFPPAVMNWFRLHEFAPYVATAGAALAIALFALPTLSAIVQAQIFRLRTKEAVHNTPLLLPLVVGGIPPMAAVLALPYAPPLPEWIYSPWSAGAGLVASGLLLAFSDHVGLTLKRIEHFGVTGGVTLALAHLMGLWPGASGIALAVAAARSLSLEKPDALRVAVLTTLPMLLVLGVRGWRAAVLPPWPGPGGPELVQHLIALTAVGALAALIGLLVTSLWLRRGGLWPFALLQVAAGVAVLAL